MTWIGKSLSHGKAKQGERFLRRLRDHDLCARRLLEMPAHLLMNGAHTHRERERGEREREREKEKKRKRERVRNGVVTDLIMCSEEKREGSLVL